MNRVHALRPSGAAIWSVCAGYVAMRAMYPDAPEEADNDVCEDGTACHWLAAEVWEGRHPALGSLSPNNRVIDEDMYDAVDLYHSVLRGAASQDIEWYIEKEIDCGLIYPGMKGTPDAWGYRPGFLRVADLKYGFRFVEVWNNKQLIIYAAAIARLLDLPDTDLVELTIVQPRSFHRDGPVRAWTTTIGAIREKAAALSKLAHATMQPAPLYTPNPGCADCPGRHACVSLQNAAYAAMEVSYSATPFELDPEPLGRELAHLRDAQKRMEARISGLEAQAECLLRDGKAVPGWHLQATFAREGWRPGDEEKVLALAKYYNVDVSKPRRAVTPNQARKLLPASVVAMFSHKPSTGVKLVKQDPNEAEKVFSSHPLR